MAKHSHKYDFKRWWGTGTALEARREGNALTATYDIKVHRWAIPFLLFIRLVVRVRRRMRCV